MKTRTYEAMFLFDSAAANQWDAVEKEVVRLMGRADADVVGIKKWDERRLAYDIDHRKRGCYVLTHFRAEASKIAPLERDARLSEMILRLLVLRSELSDEQLEEFRKESAEQAALLRDEAKARADAEKAAEEQKAAEADAKASKTPAEEPQAESQAPKPEAQAETAAAEPAEAEAKAEPAAAKPAEAEASTDAAAEPAAPKADEAESKQDGESSSAS